MNRLFILVLVALLPLRGLSAERMAIFMVSSPAASVATQAERSAMPEHCPMMMLNLPAAETGSVHPDGKSHHACKSCQLCMALATHETPVLETISFAPSTVVHILHAEQFASADLARAAKPPIS